MEPLPGRKQHNEDGESDEEAMELFPVRKQYNEEATDGEAGETDSLLEETSPV
jgi:hypothetical protein